MGIDTLLLTAALFAPAEARAPDMRIVVVVSEKRIKRHHTGNPERGSFRS
jgi:hypothetical protein